MIFGGSDQELKIARRGSVWNPRELLDTGALNGRSDGTGKFAIAFWIHRRATGEKIHVGRVAFTASDAPATAATLIAISDRGVGLVILDADYATKLRINDRGSGAWSMGSLLSSGALNGRTDGNPHFCAWLVGPPTSTYQDESGRPKYMYRYRLVHPDSSSTESSPSYFYEPGFARVELMPHLKGRQAIEFAIGD